MPPTKNFISLNLKGLFTDFTWGSSEPCIQLRTIADTKIEKLDFLKVTCIPEIETVPWIPHSKSVNNPYKLSLKTTEKCMGGMFVHMWPYYILMTG